jgi:hypothetical protein
MHGRRAGHTLYGARYAQRMRTARRSLSMVRPGAFEKTASSIRNADETFQPKEIFSNSTVTMDVNRETFDARIRQTA